MRRGLGKGSGMPGYYNLAPMDSHIHSLSAKGQKTKINGRFLSQRMNETSRTYIEKVKPIGEDKVWYSVYKKEPFWNPMGDTTLSDMPLSKEEAIKFQKRVEKDFTLNAKGAKQKDYMRAMFKFEGLNADYPNDQMEGLVSELNHPGEFHDTGYIHEKVENIKRHYTGALDNFEVRILAEQKLRDEFKELAKGKRVTKLGAKGNHTYPKEEIKEIIDGNMNAPQATSMILYNQFED